MNFEQEVSQIFGVPAWSLERIRERCLATQVGDWFRKPRYQYIIWQAIWRNELWGVRLLEWLVKEGVFSVSSCPLVFRMDNGPSWTYKSLLHCAIQYCPYPSPVLLFCVRQSTLRPKIAAFWHDALHACCGGYKRRDTCRLLMDAGNLTRDTEPCSNRQCLYVSINEWIGQRRTHLRCTLALLGLRRRVAWVRQCVTRDVMAIIAKELWRLRWFDASSFDNVLHHK